MSLFSLKDALARTPEPDFSFSVAELGDAELKFYTPKNVDPQTPHSRDEFYIIARGTGTFGIDDRSYHFAPGDVLFVSAGVEHRFRDFSDDFATWVLFIGER
ncbi:MAG: cupin domain-containing protein [Candidatus Eremiobacteraeota bacterium]|nr:cupin domain-containing protein [Candidatus Eremiobacteraeota bacterium]